TFHISCTLDTAQTNWVGLYDNGGKLIDEINVPILTADHSYARLDDANSEWVEKGGNDVDSYVTPSTNNMTIDKNVKEEKFALHDANGIGMSITAMLVVFFGLILLYVMFRLLGLGMQSKKTTETSKSTDMTEKQSTPQATGKEGEVYAAIAMALHEEMNNVHDIESGILTITRRTSAWNAKHLMLRK
ncbi:MAG: OadG family protein, partial [Bacteroidaceae bacterium]|nr:OadG family protein [Bacteroidaceae bacterium]